MSNLKKTILSKLHERTVSPEELKTNTDDLVKTAKDALDIDDTQAKDYVSGFIGEDNDEITSRGIDAGMNPEVEADKYAEYRALMAQLAAEEGGEEPIGPVSEGGPTTDIEGVTDSLVNMYINGSSDDEVYIIAKKTLDGHGADSQTKREFYMTLANKLKKASLNNSSLSDELMRASQSYNSLYRTGIKEEDGMGQEPQEKNDPVKLKADVAKLMARLDMSSITPYLDRIDNPVEQAEVIGQFAEKIGVPRARLGAVIAQLKQVAENTNPKITKDGLIETVTGRKIIKTIKVKDIK